MCLQKETFYKIKGVEIWNNIMVIKCLYYELYFRFMLSRQIFLSNLQKMSKLFMTENKTPGQS